MPGAILGAVDANHCGCLMDTRTRVVFQPSVAANPASTRAANDAAPATVAIKLAVAMPCRFLLGKLCCLQGTTVITNPMRGESKGYKLAVVCGPGFPACGNTKSSTARDMTCTASSESKPNRTAATLSTPVVHQTSEACAALATPSCIVPFGRL